MSKRETFGQRVTGSISANIPDGSELPVSPRYREIQDELQVVTHNEKVTMFFGGPLDLNKYGITDAWVVPAEVKDAAGLTNFHVVAINCKNGKDLSQAKVYVHLLPEHSLKVREDTPEVRQYEEDLLGRGDEPRVIVRPSFVGSLAFPLMQTPNDFPETTNLIYSRLWELLLELNLVDMDRIEVKPYNLASMNQEFRAEFERFILLEPFILQNAELGTIYVNRIYSKEDPWFYYEVFSFSDILSVRNNRNATMRVDSGCDSGMLYHDQACDCHAQLLDALKKAKEDNGFVVHCPIQDGRGYGMNTKMETEAHKHGVEAVFNKGLPPQATLTVAKELFGDGYHDIRTFENIGLVLEDMGFSEISMITDNRRKIEQIGSATRRLKVTRIATRTEENGNIAGCRKHVLEKHASPEYF